MKTSTLQLLAAATVIAVGAAAWSLKSNKAAVKPQPRGNTALFPGLRDKVNEVASVTVTSAEESFTLEKKGDQWGAASKGGYPVDVNKVKALVVGIASLTVLDEKTKNPQLYAKLEVDEPTASGSKAKQVTLKDKNQAVLADLIVGKTGQGRSFTGDPSLFVRKAGQAVAQEVAGNLTVEATAANWLDKQVAKLEKKRVRSVETTHPDGEKLTVERASSEQENFDVRDLPAGSELSWPGVAGSIGGALEWMNFEDVKPASEVDFTAQELTTARFETFDGLVVTATTMQKDDKVYLKLESTFDESKRQAPPVGPQLPPTAPETAASETPEKPPEALTPPAAALKSVEETRSEAEKLAARTGSWVYVVPGWGASNLRKRVKDLLKQPEPPAAEDAPEAPASVPLTPIEPPPDEVLQEQTKPEASPQEGAAGGG
jgi:hypothetical protein